MESEPRSGGTSNLRRSNNGADVDERHFTAPRRFDAAFDGEAVDQLVLAADRYSGVSFPE